MSLIPVKKKDGTIVKMTMAEFLDYKKNLDKKPEPIKKKVKKKNLPVKNTPHNLSTTTPVKEIFVDQAIAKSRPKKKIKPVKNLTGTDLEKILQQLDFDISKDLHVRLDMLLKSRIKNVRTDDQVMAYSLRQLDKGGLGLDKNQAEKLVQAMKSVMGTQPTVMNRRERKKAMSLALEPKLNMARDRAKSKSKLATMQNAKLVESPKLISRRPSFPKAPLDPLQRKPVLNDVIPPKVKKKSVGPIDEIRQFDIVEFRRLATNLDQTKELLLNKFITLKEESFMLYTQAKRAWAESPLYKQYQDIIKESLEKEESGIAEVINTRGDMKLEEFMAIVDINKKL
jgi:hypothetical protein